MFGENCKYINISISKSKLCKSTNHARRLHTDVLFSCGKPEASHSNLGGPWFHCSLKELFEVYFVKRLSQINRAEHSTKICHDWF